MPSQTKSILKLKRLFVDLNLQGAVENVRRLTGKGQIRQGYEILCLALGPRRFSPVEYYTEGLWRTDLSAEMRASLQHGDEVVILVRREVIASFSAIKDIVCYITTERNNEKEQAGCFGYLRDTPVITDLALKKNGGSLLCDVVFVSTKDGAIIDVVAANFVGVS